MDLFILQRVEVGEPRASSMARLVIHTHGTPKEKAAKTLLEMYAQRLKTSGVKLEYHSSKEHADAYVRRLLDLGGTVVLLDESGEQMDSLTFARRVEQWQLSTKSVHLALGPAEGWPATSQLDALARCSLSPMTFPHELAAVMLAEQVYRATEILRGTGYHKA